VRGRKVYTFSAPLTLPTGIHNPRLRNFKPSPTGKSLQSQRRKKWQSSALSLLNLTNSSELARAHPPIFLLNIFSPPFVHNVPQNRHKSGNLIE
jgi:hypothetical protein